MPEYILDRRDVDFVLFEQFGLGALKRFSRYAEFDEDDFRAILDAAEKLNVEVIAPTNEVGDRVGTKLIDGNVVTPKGFKEACKAYGENGFVAPSRPTEFGGMGLPVPMYLVCSEMSIGASPAFYFFPGLSTASGHLLESFASEAMRDLIVPRLYSAQWTSTMCLTEPQAGTSIGDIKTSAKPVDGADHYLVKGNKIFITCGDHDCAENIIHLVLARVEGDPEGTKGISLFMVPKFEFDDQGKLGERNDVVVTALEHKMGINASPTCAMSFGDEDSCKGWLIGERCNGLNLMFQMMNDARLAAGTQGVATGNAAYQLALAYAKERIQGKTLVGGQPARLIDHPDVRRNLMLCKSIGEGIRALLVQAAFFTDIAEESEDPAEKTKYQDLLDLMTPICKAYATDMGFKMTELAIQIHGGYGYTQDYGVEQAMRDIKIASIYEGANGIQALDLLGRKMRLKGGALFMTWMQDVVSWVEKHKGHETLGALVEAVDKGKNHLGAVAMGFQAQGKEDPNLAMLGATPYLEMFGHVEVARLLVDAAIIAKEKLDALMAEKSIGAEGLKAFVEDNAEARFYDGKIKVAHFFVSTFIPQAIALGKSIQQGDRSALDIVF